jgi:hypothetical protein
MRRLELTVTGNTVGRLPMMGLLGQVYLEYAGGHTASTDVTLFRQVGANEHVILTVTDSNTNANYVPRLEAVGGTAAAITGSAEMPMIDGDLVMRVAGGNANGTVKAYITVIDDDVYQGRR